MKRIWSIKQGIAGKPIMIASYPVVVSSVRATFGYTDLPEEKEVGDNTKIGFMSEPGEWIQINAVMVHESGPVKLD